MYLCCVNSINIVQHKEVGSKLKLELDYEKKSVKELEHLISKMDSLSEELRIKKKIIAELESDKARLMAYKDQYMQIKTENENFKDEKKGLIDELASIKEELLELKNRNQQDSENGKQTIEELSNILNKERETHKIEEGKLHGTIKTFESKIKALSNALNEAKKEKDRNQAFYQEQLEVQKESKKSMSTEIEKAKQKEIEYEKNNNSNMDKIEGLRAEKKNLEKKIEMLFGELQTQKENSDTINEEREKSASLVEKCSKMQERMEKSEEALELINNKYMESKEELEKFHEIIQKQDKTIKLLKDNMLEDKETIKRLEDDIFEQNEKRNVVFKDREGLLTELDYEKKKVQELEQLVQALNENRNEMENEIAQLSEAKERLQAEIQSFSDERRYLSEARSKDLHLLSKALSSAYTDKN